MTALGRYSPAQDAEKPLAPVHVVVMPDKSISFGVELTGTGELAGIPEGLLRSGVSARPCSGRQLVSTSALALLTSTRELGGSAKPGC